MAPPPNDNWADAELVTVPSVVSGTTIEATFEITGDNFDGWSESGYAQPSVFYRIPVVEAGYLKITARGIGGFRPYGELYRSGTDDLAAPSAWEDGRFASWFETGPGGSQIINYLPVVPGEYIMWVGDWDFDANEGDFELEFEVAVPTADDLNYETRATPLAPSDIDPAPAQVDPFSVVYMRVGHTTPIAYDIRKSTAAPTHDDLGERYVFENPSAICPNGLPAGTFSNLFASPQPGEPSHAGFPARRSVWFEWTPSGVGLPYDIWVEATSDDYVLAVYELTGAVDELIEIASDDDSGVGNQPLVTITADGNPVLIVVDSKGNGGDFVLRAELSASIPRPPNNDFGDATPLPGTSGTISGSLEGSTYQCGTPPLMTPIFPSGTAELPPIGGDVWYQFVPTGTDYTLTWNSPNPVRISVWTGTSLGGLTSYTPFGNGQGYSGPWPTGTHTFAVTPGTTYWVRVEQADGDQTDIEFDFENLIPSPDNGDGFEDPPGITFPPGGGSGDGDTIDLGGAGQQPNEPVDEPGQQIRSVWRTFTPEHDCTVFITWTNPGFTALIGGTNTTQIDVWRGETLGSLDLVPGQLSFGAVGQFAVRLKKDEKYRIRFWNPRTQGPPAPFAITTRVEYEMDEPWTDADGFDDTFGVSSFVDGVLTVSEPAYRTIESCWVGEQSSMHTWVSFDVRITAEFSPTAADGPVLGRQPGPINYYPWAGNRISLCRLHYTTQQPGGGSVNYLSLVGDLDGNFYLEMWNGVGGGNSVATILLNPFAAPNGETEGGEWIPIDITPGGIFVHGRCVSQQGFTQWTAYLSKVDFGGVLFPIDTFWGSGGPAPKDPPYGPPEEWTLQLRNMRITDRVATGPRLFYSDIPGDEDPIQNHMIEWDTRIGAEDNVGDTNYPLKATFLNAGEGAEPDPATLNEPNPGTRTWDTIRVHDKSYYWNAFHADNPQRHSGFWIWFDEFPAGAGAINEVCIAAGTVWGAASGGGTSFGYFQDLGRLVVDGQGILWIYPNRNWREGDTATFNNQYVVYDPGNRKYQIGTLALQTWYWIEQITDHTWPWDVVCRVAVNEVECQAEYRSLLSQSLGEVGVARYTGTIFVLGHAQGFGVLGGWPNPVGASQAFTGTVDISLGPWMIGRGGLRTYVEHRGDGLLLEEANLSEPLLLPGVGAHAGAIIAVNDDDGVHHLLDIDDCEPFDFDGPEDAPLFTYDGVRLYKGSKSAESSFNHDMSAGVSGYHAKNIGAQPSLDPVLVADGSGPVIGPYDYSGESAVEFGHDPDGPGGDDYSGWTILDPYSYIGNIPPEGVREGGDPNDDGGNHFLVVLFARAIGATPIMDAFSECRGVLAQGPHYGLTTNWVRIYGQTYPNPDLSSGPANGVWQFEGLITGGVVRIKHCRTFLNPMVYPRFATTTDNGASYAYLEHADDPVAAFLNDDPLEDTPIGVFLDNVCSFSRMSRTGPRVPGLLGEPPTGISMGDYRTRYYVEVLPPTEPELEDTNLQIASLRVMVRGAGYGASGGHAWHGDISTARTGGTLKVRMVGGSHRLVVGNFAVTATDRAYRSQVLPMTPMGFNWQTDRVAETKIRMGYHFNYEDLIHDVWGYETRQAGGAIVKSVAYEVFCKVQPGPPICGGMRWNSRVVRKV